MGVAPSRLFDKAIFGQSYIQSLEELTEWLTERWKVDRVKFVYTIEFPERKLAEIRVRAELIKNEELQVLNQVTWWARELPVLERARLDRKYNVYAFIQRMFRSYYEQRTELFSDFAIFFGPPPQWIGTTMRLPQVTASAYNIGSRRFLAYLADRMFKLWTSWTQRSASGPVQTHGGLLYNAHDLEVQLAPFRDGFEVSLSLSMHRRMQIIGNQVLAEQRRLHPGVADQSLPPLTDLQLQALLSPNDYIQYTADLQTAQLGQLQSYLVLRLTVAPTPNARNQSITLYSFYGDHLERWMLPNSYTSMVDYLQLMAQFIAQSYSEFASARQIELASKIAILGAARAETAQELLGASALDVALQHMGVRSSLAPEAIDRARPLQYRDIDSTVSEVPAPIPRRFRLG